MDCTRELGCWQQPASRRPRPSSLPGQVPWGGWVVAGILAGGGARVVALLACRLAENRSHLLWALRDQVAARGRTKSAGSSVQGSVVDRGQQLGDWTLLDPSRASWAATVNTSVAPSFARSGEEDGVWPCRGGSSGGVGREELVEAAGRRILRPEHNRPQRGEEARACQQRVATSWRRLDPVAGHAGGDRSERAHV